jgi:hypothetical protein
MLRALLIAAVHRQRVQRLEVGDDGSIYSISRCATRINLDSYANGYAMRIDLMLLILCWKTTVNTPENAGLEPNPTGLLNYGVKNLAAPRFQTQGKSVSNLDYVFLL